MKKLVNKKKIEKKKGSENKLKLFNLPRNYSNPILKKNNLKNKNIREMIRKRM